MKLLIVDDEDKIRQFIEKYAKFDGYETAACATGLEAIERVKTENFDLIIMDVMMPELDGFSAAKEIRKFSDTPLLFLSARTEEYDRIHGFESGGDDYVVKPFSPKELMLRIKAILSRSGKADTNSIGGILEAEPPHEIWSKDGLSADITARTVTVDGVRANMSPKEFALFFYLLKNRNIALTREKILSAVWGYDFFGIDRTLDTHIKLLRKSLGKYAGYIVTLRSMGYRFEV